MCGATGSVKPFRLVPFFVSTFHLPFPSSLFLSHFFPLVEARYYYFYVLPPLYRQPWLRVSIWKRLERDSRNFTYVRATGNSVNSKSAGRERRPEPLLDSQSLFIRFMVLRFHGARAPPWCSGGKRVSFCYAPSNRGTSVRLITSRLFERARLDIDFSEKKSDTILRFEISKTNY